MSPSLSHKPLLPSHYFLWADPPDEAGDEVLHIVSERRSLKLKGQAFREFTKLVVPLLDGRRTIAEIQDAVGGTFRPEDVVECLELLAGHGVVVAGDTQSLAPEVGDRLTPQINFFHDVLPGAAVQTRLTSATVAVIGLGGPGATVATALGSAGIGVVRCIDALPVQPSDAYWSPVYSANGTAEPRAEALVRALRATAPQTIGMAEVGTLESEADLQRVVEGADYVVCCLDPSQSNLIYKLNRVCLRAGVRWCACALAGTEVVVGPAMHPGRSPCYLCYRMRSIACAGSPEEAFAHEQFLDRRKHDDSGRRGNIVFGAGLAGHFVALEVFNTLAEIGEPSLVGRILTINLTTLVTEHHVVLRKPWCPACFAPVTETR